jgi:propanediol dehydratase small subunit
LALVTGTGPVLEGRAMKRLVLSGVLAVGLMVGGAATAGADEPVTITLSPEQVTNLCEKRLPKIEKRATNLLARINGDAATRGSVEWLRARAATERDAGRETTAQMLDERADRRAGNVDKINQVKKWVDDFQAQHCEAK